MPLLSRVGIRLSFLYLMVGSVIGALMLLAKGGYPVSDAALNAGTIHAEMLLVGWLVQLAFGVGYWILPRHPVAPVRGAILPPMAAIVLLNLGLVLAAAGGPGDRTGLVVAGRALEAAAVGAFLLHAWPRVRRSGRVFEMRGTSRD